MLRARTILMDFCETLRIGNHPFPLSRMKRRQRQRRRRRRRRTNAIRKTTFNRRSSVRKRQIRARPRRGTDRYARTRPKKYHGTTLKVNKRTTGCEHEGNFSLFPFFISFFFFFKSMEKTWPYTRQTNKAVSTAIKNQGHAATVARGGAEGFFLIMVRNCA